ncbi:MAG: hypothetical protein H7174_10710 [Flavobacterium sp.]|nr:hypothetical protein [Flavobacterium sp.]
MENKDILKNLSIGFLIGIISCLIGSYLFIYFFTQYAFIEGVNALKSAGHLGQLITLGAILNILIFFGLLNLNKEIMARGAVMATIILTIITLFV